MSGILNLKSTKHLHARGINCFLTVTQFFGYFFAAESFSD